MEYFLMRKDHVITVCNLTDNGQMISWSENIREPELAPLEQRISSDYLQKWWNNRQSPISQGRLAEFLEQRGLTDPGDYLLRNLGLSLTDYYWMKPVGSHLTWNDVNLYENDFRENILRSIDDGWSRTPAMLSPNSSLRGELEKTWVIRQGKRVLIKGNRGERSSESLNELIATKLHRSQGWDNYTSYKLVSIKDKPYDYGCSSPAFTSSSRELISAYAVITSEEKPYGCSVYEHFIRIALAHGMDEAQLRCDLEYQILSDYLLTNVDRHMENIGILRDAETLEWIRLAPIFDTGRAFNAGGITPYTDKEIDRIQVNSFAGTEEELLSLVTDRGRVDPAKAISPDVIRRVYEKDSKATPRQIDDIVRLYEIKLDRLEKFASEKG